MQIEGDMVCDDDIKEDTPYVHMWFRFGQVKVNQNM